MRILGLTMTALFLAALGAPLAHAQSNTPIMNLYVMKDQGRITGQVSVPVSNTVATIGKVSFSGFTNTTITDDGATLWVSHGVSQGMALVVMSFTDTSSQGTSKIDTVMASSDSGSGGGDEGGDESNDGSKSDSGGMWGAVIHADYTPASNRVSLGDGFFLNYTSSLSGQYAGLATGITQAGQNYLRSDDGKLRTLGGYYLVLAHEISKMKGMVPHDILGNKVKAAMAVGSDYDLLACLGALAALASASAAFIATCVTPAVILVLPCVAVTAALLSAFFAVEDLCR